MFKYLIITIALMFGLKTAAQKTYTHIALLNGIAHVGDGRVIENSLVAIRGTTIETVMSALNLKLNYRNYDTVIDISGHHVYPALINCNNILGLHDAEAVRATADYVEVGAMNPHVRALTAYNTDNVIVPTVKTNGVLYTQVTPRGGRISGSSSVMALDGWNWEDAVLKADDGIHLNFPEFPIARNTDEEEGPKNREKKYAEELEQIGRFFDESRVYCLSNDVTEKNLRFEAVRGVMAGRANLYLHVNRVKDLLAAMQFVNRFNIKKPVIVGGKEAYKVIPELKRSGIPVMLGRVNDLPDYIGDDIDLIYRLPGMLQHDSILYCLQLEGDMEAMHSRNLPFNAGAAVPYGITTEQALSAITSSPARILGIDRQLGTLTEGKLASVVVSAGDILDMRTNRVILAYISGKSVALDNAQLELYKRYKEKYGVK